MWPVVGKCGQPHGYVCSRPLSLHLSKQGTDRGGEQLPTKCPCRWRRKYIRTELWTPPYRFTEHYHCRHPYIRQPSTWQASRRAWPHRIRQGVLCAGERLRYAPLTFSFGCTIYKPSSKLTDDENKLELLYSAFVRATCISGREQVWHWPHEILHQLIEAAVLEENDYAIKGFSTTLQVGQAILSEVDLSSKLGYDKKTISRVLDKMNQLRIVASAKATEQVSTRWNVYRHGWKMAIA